MALAIFDLDNTLLGGDSDYQWGQFLVDQKVVHRESYEAQNAQFYEEYKAGKLDIYEFLRFALAPLAQNKTEDLNRWRKSFVEERIRPLLLPAAFQLVEAHRRKGDTLLVITATNQFVTQPIVELYGIENLIATIPEFIKGSYTGAVEGTPSFQHGKVERLESWLEESGESLENSWFYSDSCNDLPLLKKVTHPVAVDPDNVLAEHAQQSGWPIMTLREPSCDPDFLNQIR